MQQCLTKISVFHIYISVVIVIVRCGLIQTGDIVHFISEPSTQMISRDRRGIFRCLASPPGVRIEWLQNGHPVQEDSAGIIRLSENKLVVRLQNHSNETFPPRSTEHINLLVAKGRHHLQCLARFKGQGVISQRSGVMLAEMSPFASQPDVNLTVIKGNMATIVCTPPDSVPSAVTEFSFNGESIHFSSDKYIHLPSGNLQILNAQPSDTGTYQCSAHNPFLNERKTAKHRVHLYVLDAVQKKHVVMTTPQPPQQVSAPMGMNLTFECTAEGFPVPTITWHRKGGHSLPTRHQQIAGNLLLFTVRSSDVGVYVCKAQNDQGRVFMEVELKVMEIPHILRPPEKHQAYEGGSVFFSCLSEGKPLPNITWYHNGMKIHDNLHFSRNDSSLCVRNIRRNHAGIYQCFATNEVGSVHASGLLTILSDAPLPTNSTKPGSNHYVDPEFVDGEDEDELDDTPNVHRTKQKGVKMVPPSKPEVTRLSEDSVMVRWSVPSNNGLRINFFKVQFQEFDKNRGGPWSTIDEDIPFQINTYAVTQLKPGGKYKFRIAAVYSNNDNRSGPKSAKFTLTRNPLLKRPQFAPVIVHAMSPNSSTIHITWEFAAHDMTIQGFFIYYRTTESAGDYAKSTVLGANTEVHTISHLLPQTSYDIKIQCFNAAGPSDFSNIYTCKTKSGGVMDPVQHVEQDVERPYPTMESNENDSNNRHVILSIVLGVLGLLVLVLVLWFLIKRCTRVNPPPQDASGNTATAGLPAKHLVNGFSQNGFLDPSKINIQVNPLSENEANKTIESPYSLMEYQEEPFNNNEVILLSTLQRNCKNSTGV